MGKRSRSETEKIRSKNTEPNFTQTQNAQETANAPKVPPPTPTKVPDTRTLTSSRTLHRQSSKKPSSEKLKNPLTQHQ